MCSTSRMYSRNLSVETDGCIIHACASKIICEVAVREKSTVAEGFFKVLFSCTES